MNKISLPVIEFYITNVCNLECRGCNRFNNYKFKGHYYWSDCAEEIEKWSHRIQPESIFLMGGEPTLNPRLDEWLVNLRRLWPETKITIQSNGTKISEKVIQSALRNNVGIAVAVHDPDTADDIAISRSNRGVKLIKGHISKSITRTHWLPLIAVV